MDNSKKSITNINLNIPEGMNAEVKLIGIEQKPRYIRIGNGIRNTFMGKQHSPIDAIDQMAEMSIRELYVLKILKDNFILKEEMTDKGIKKRTSCISNIKNSTLTNSEQQKFKAGFKKLKEKNIVKRVKREQYLINPDFIIPHFYKEEKKQWDELKL